MDTIIGAVGDVEEYMKVYEEEKHSFLWEIVEMLSDNEAIVESLERKKTGTIAMKEGFWIWEKDLYKDEIKYYFAWDDDLRIEPGSKFIQKTYDKYEGYVKNSRIDSGVKEFLEGKKDEKPIQKKKRNFKRKIARSGTVVKVEAKPEVTLEDLDEFSEFDLTSIIL